MRKEITYAGQVHKVIVDDYINVLDLMIKEITDEEKYNEFIDSLNQIVDYHNNYGDTDESNYYDWLMILPLNVSQLVQGIFVGVENKDNRAEVRQFRAVLDMELQTVVENLSTISIFNA